MTRPRRPRILALDLSLTATGVVTPDGHADTLRPPAHLGTGGERLEWWRASLIVLIADSRPDCIVIERPFEGGYAGTTLALGGVYGIFAEVMARRPIVVTHVPPSTLKKAWTGYGTAMKSGMRAEAVRRGLGVDGLDDNAIDALALWVLATAGVFDEGGE